MLDFLVVSYWLSLLLSSLWAITFALNGEVLGALLAAVLGPSSCWIFWYGAAVEQYRTLQSLITSSLNTSRFQVISDLRLSLPADLLEERDIWRTIDFAIGNGEPLNIRYQHPKT